MSHQEHNPYLIPLSILAVGVLIAGAMIYSNRNNSKPSSVTSPGDNIPAQTVPTRRPTVSAINIKNVQIKGEPFIGKVNTPVVLAYWFDFQCPFCKRFETNTLPVLVDRYVKEGKLKIIFKDFQFLGPDSVTAGIAEKAIWQLYPTKYFQWHQAMYGAQDGENRGWGNRADILKLAGSIPGIDANKVSQLMTKNRAQYIQEENADKTEGAKFNINGTPGFVIGTQSIYGAQPTSVFTQMIDAELRSVKSKK